MKKIHFIWWFLILVWLWVPENGDTFGVLSPFSLSLLVSPFSAPIRFARPLTSLMTLNALTSAKTGLLLAYKDAQKRVKPQSYYEKVNQVGHPSLKKFSPGKLRRDYYEQEADKGLGIRLKVEVTHPLIERAKEIHKKLVPRPKKKIKFRPLDSYPLWIQQQIQPNPHSWTGLGLDLSKTGRPEPPVLPPITGATIDIETVPNGSPKPLQPPKHASIEITSVPLHPQIPPPPPKLHHPQFFPPVRKPENIQDIVKLPSRPIPPPPKPIGYLDELTSSSGHQLHDGFLGHKFPDNLKPGSPFPVPQLPIFEFPNQYLHKPPFHPDFHLPNTNKDPIKHDKYLMPVLNVMNNKDSFLKALPWRPSEANTHEHVTLVPDRPERDVFVLTGMNAMSHDQHMHHDLHEAGSTRVEFRPRPNEIPEGITHLPRSVGQGGEFVHLTHPSELPDFPHQVKEPSVVTEYGGFRPIYSTNVNEKENERHVMVQHGPNGQIHFLPAAQVANIQETDFLPREKYFDWLRKNITDYKHAILIPVKNYEPMAEESQRRLNFTLFRPNKKPPNQILRGVPKNSLKPVVISKPSSRPSLKPKPSRPESERQRTKTTPSSRGNNKPAFEQHKLKNTFVATPASKPTTQNTNTEPVVITKDSITNGRLNNKNAVILTKVKAPMIGIQNGGGFGVRQKELAYPPVVGTPVGIETANDKIISSSRGTQVQSQSTYSEDNNSGLTNHNFNSQLVVPENHNFKASNINQGQSQQVFSPSNEKVLQQSISVINPNNQHFGQQPQTVFNPTNQQNAQPQNIVIPNNQQNLHPQSAYSPTNQQTVHSQTVFNPTNQQGQQLQNVFNNQVQNQHGFNSPNQQVGNQQFSQSTVERYPNPSEGFHSQRIIPTDKDQFKSSSSDLVGTAETTPNNSNRNLTYIEWLEKYYPHYYNKYFNNVPASSLLRDERKSNNAYLDWLNKYFPNWRNVSYTNQNVSYYDWLKTYYPAYYQKHYATKLEFDGQATSASESQASYSSGIHNTGYVKDSKKPDWTVDVSLKRPRTENPFAMFESRDPFSSLLFGDNYKVPYPSPPTIDARDYLAERLRNRGKVKASIEITKGEADDHSLNNVVNYADYMIKRRNTPECLLHLVCHVDDLIHRQVVKKREQYLYQRRQTSSAEENATWRRRQRIRQRLLNQQNDDVRCDETSHTQRNSCQRLESEEEVLAKMIEVAFPT